MLSWMFLLVGWASALDALRFPASSWAAADKGKGVWVSLLVVFGGLMFVPYWVWVRPALTRGADLDAHNPFLKHAPTHDDAGTWQ